LSEIIKGIIHAPQQQQQQEAAIPLSSQKEQLQRKALAQQEQWLQEPVNGQQQQSGQLHLGSQPPPQPERPHLRHLRRQQQQWASQPVIPSMAPESQQDATVLKQMLQPLKKPYRRTEEASRQSVVLPQFDRPLASQPRLQQQSLPQQQQQQQQWQLYQQWQQSQRSQRSQAPQQQQHEEESTLMRKLEQESQQLLQREVQQGHQEQQAEQQAAEAARPVATPGGRRLLFSPTPVGFGGVAGGLLSAAIAVMPSAVAGNVVPGALPHSSPEGATEESSPGDLPPLAPTSLFSVAESSSRVAASPAAHPGKFGVGRTVVRPARFDYLRKLSPRKPQAAPPVHLLASGDEQLADEEARVKAELARAEQELQAGAQAMATAEHSLEEANRHEVGHHRAMAGTTASTANTAARLEQRGKDATAPSEGSAMNSTAIRERLQRERAELMERFIEEDRRVKGQMAQARKEIEAGAAAILAAEKRLLEEAGDYTNASLLAASTVANADTAKTAHGAASSDGERQLTAQVAEQEARRSALAAKVKASQRHYAEVLEYNSLETRRLKASRPARSVAGNTAPRRRGR
jgi:hypothetical protein